MSLAIYFGAGLRDGDTISKVFSREQQDQPNITVYHEVENLNTIPLDEHRSRQKDTVYIPEYFLFEFPDANNNVRSFIRREHKCNINSGMTSEETKAKNISKSEFAFNNYISGLNNSNDMEPNAITLNNGIQWLIEVEEAIAEQEMSWDTPHISTGMENEIMFEWWCKERKITIYILDDTIEYLISWGKSIQNDMKDGLIKTIDDMIKLWCWLKYNERFDEC